MSELYHYGIKGQRWGDRRYQNEDGSLTPAGKERYLKDGYGTSAKRWLIKKNYKNYDKYSKKYENEINKMQKKKNEGKKITELDKKRATKYGSAAKSALKYSKNLDKWLDREGKALTTSTIAGIPFLAYNMGVYSKNLSDIAAGKEISDVQFLSSMGKQTVAIAGQIIAQNVAYNASLSNAPDANKYKKWGESIKESSKNETIADLKKKGLM